MKKPDSKIKEMLIFPYNFSTIKKFENNIKKINTPNINFNTKFLSRNNKSNRYMKNNINLSNRQINFENNNFNTGRNISKNLDNNSKITTRSKAHSENKIKINLGIIKEICFLNNNL